MPRKKSEHYVNNKELLEALIVYREKVAIAKEKDSDDTEVIQSRSKKGKVKLSGDPRLGYISSVEKKRQSLEELFKSDSKEP